MIEGGADRGYTLVVHPGAVGDVLLAVPALRALRRAGRGDAAGAGRQAPAPPAPAGGAGAVTGAGALVLAAQPRLGALLHALGVVDRHLALESLGLEALFAGEVPAQDAGVIGRAGRVVCWLGARDPLFVGALSRLSPAASIAPSAPPPAASAPPPAAGPALVWRHLVETAGVQPASADREPVAVPPALTAAGRDALRAAGWDGATPLLLVHPGAGGPSKRWPADGFGRVLDAIRRRRGAAIVLHQGPADAEAVAALAGRLDGPAPVLREPPLPVLAGALVHAAAYLGNDSGVSHLAAAVGSPAVILFAPVNVPWRPWAPAARTLVVAGPAVDGADVAAAVAALDALLGRPAPALPRAADG